MFESLKVSVRVLPCWELGAGRPPLGSAAKESVRLDVNDLLRTSALTRD